MASEEEDRAEQDCVFPTASTSQVAQAVPLGDSEDLSCPACQDAIDKEACGSSCRHCFCFLCVEEWVSSREVCPNCQWPLQHLFPKMSAHNHELDNITCDDNDSRGRSRCRSEGWWQHSSGYRHHGSSSRDRGGGHARAPRGSSSWSQDGCRWGHQSRRQWWSRDRERPHAWESQRRRFPEQGMGNPGTVANGSPARWRRGRSWNPDEHRAPRPEQAVPAFLRRSRSWAGSHSTWSRAQRERQRRRDWDEVPTYPGRRARHQRGRRSSFSATRSRSWRRSRGRAGCRTR